MRKWSVRLVLDVQLAVVTVVQSLGVYRDGVLRARKQRMHVQDDVVQQLQWLLPLPLLSLLLLLLRLPSATAPLWHRCSGSQQIFSTEALRSTVG